MDKQQVIDYLNAGYPALWIQDRDEERVINELKAIAISGKRDTDAMQMRVWSCSTGFIDPMSNEKQHKATMDIVAALNFIEEKGTDYCLYVFKNIHFYLNAPMVLQKIKDLLNLAKFNERHLIFISCERKLPPEIEKDITFIDNPLPDCEELRHIFEGVLDSISDSGTKVTAPKQEELISAALGLTPLEAENAFAYAYVKHKTFDEHALITVQELKTSFINKSGVLEFVPRQYDLDDIGGLATLKEWLSLRKLAFTPEAKEFGLSTPKGVLLAGVPGAGKSLSAKALSAAWELPLLRFDVGKVFHSLVGESEQKMREALLMAEAMSPCILWIDEIEKAFSGTTNGGDGGVTSRIFGQFLTWMQEKTAPVFIFATANHIHSLPPEFLRKGRFDEFFFVDLPDEEERHVILNIHFAKKKRNPSDFDLELLVRESDGFSGAELESCISQSLFKAFSQNRDVVTLDVLSTMQSTTPLSETMKEHIDALRKWAKERAKPASKTKSNFDSAVVDFQKKKSSN